MEIGTAVLPPAVHAGSSACEDGSSKASDVVGGCPEAPEGTALLVSVP